MKTKPQPYDADSYANIPLEKSVHQTSDRIFHRPGYRYDEAKAVKSVSIKNSVITAKLELDSGATATLILYVWSEDVIRLNFTLDGCSSAIEKTSDMLVAKPVNTPAPILEENGETHTIRVGGRSIVLGGEPFDFQVLDANGSSAFKTESYPLAGSPLVGALGFRIPALKNETPEPYLSWSIRNGEKFFGLGEKWNKVEKSSTRATIWASDTCGSNSNDMSYKSIPYLLSSRGWGIFLHSSFRSFWEVGSFSYVSGSCLTEDDKLDAFLFFGDGIKELIRIYTGLTGRPAMPPKWALGLWMSRCQYMNAGEAEAAMDGLRTRGIPADVIHLDPLWMKTHYYFKIGVDACDFIKNDAAFPDLPGLWKKWRANGFKTCLWVNPYIPEGGEIYDYAASHDYLLKSTCGGLARLSHGEPVGMVDFSNPAAREWWKGKLKELLADGAAVLKPDYGDRIPEDALFHNGKTGRELHNMFLFWFTETCYQACKEVHDYGMVWRRAGYIGSQRYPGTWAGDTRSTWEEMLACLRGGLSAGFNGDAFWAGDIGGFTGPTPSPELYIRWAQWGLLSPLARFHGTNCPREPWHFGDTAVAVVKHYAQLRYRLMPYLVRCAEEACASGLPILRHLHLEYPNEPGTEFIDDQYLLGPDLLVAPVFAAGATERTVYFPAGQWIDFDDASTVYDGPRWHTVPAPLERIPLFRRATAELLLNQATTEYIEQPDHQKKIW
jgi:alpha-D-xyloside xylohydrolase